MKIIALMEKPDVIKRILSHLKLGPCKDAARGPPSPASLSGGLPTQPHHEPLIDDLPLEEPTLEDSGSPEDDEPNLDADGPPDDEPIGDRA